MDRGSQFIDIRHKFNEHAFQHEYTAHLNDEQIGHMHLSPGGDVIDIQVHPDHRRKGVATALWNHAIKMAGTPTVLIDEIEQMPYPEHSGHRTEAGEAWAKSTGPAHYYPPEEIH